MSKSSADDNELRRACGDAIEDTKQKIVMSIRVAKSKGAWGKGKIGSKGSQMAKPRVLAISSIYNLSFEFFPLSIYLFIKSNLTYKYWCYLCSKS